MGKTPIRGGIQKLWDASFPGNITRPYVIVPSVLSHYGHQRSGNKKTKFHLNWSFFLYITISLQTIRRDRISYTSCMKTVSKYNYLPSCVPVRVLGGGSIRARGFSTLAYPRHNQWTSMLFASTWEERKEEVFKHESQLLKNQKPKAYIPLQRKIPGVGGWRWAMPPTPEFCMGDTNMLVYFGVTPDANPKICVTPDANPRRQSVEYR